MVSIRDISALLVPAHSNEAIQNMLGVRGRDDWQGDVSRFLTHRSVEDEARTARNASAMIAEQFGGDAIAWKAFMYKMATHNQDRFDFDTFVESGTARKLATLAKQNPTAFETILSGSHSELLAMTQAVDKVNAPTAHPVQGPRFKP